MSKTSWTNQYKDIENSSKFHNKVKEILRKHPIFSQYHCYQEVPVTELVPSYHTNRHRYDWYIEEINLIIELHGMQHYQATNFGNVGYDQAQYDYQQSRKRDRKKKEAALKAGFVYLEVHYKHYKKLTEKYLEELIFGAFDE